MKKLMTTGLSKGLLLVGCSALVVGLAQAKPDGGKGDKGGNKDGGGSGHSEKQDKGKGSDKDHEQAGKGKSDDKHEAKNDDKHDAKNEAKNEKNENKGEGWKGKRFEDNERSVFYNYFDKFKGEPQGLPPGLAMNLKRGKPLPPGWEKKVSEGYIIDDENSGFFQQLDEALFPNYNRVPDTKLYMYGDRVVRVYEPRRQVIDIFQIPGIKLF